MKPLIVLLLLTLASFSATSQTVSNKITLPVSQVREMMRLNEVRKVQAVELAATKVRVVLQDSIITSQDSTISADLQLIAAKDFQLSLSDERISVLKQENLVRMEDNDKLTASNKWLKVKNKVTAGAGIVLVAAAVAITLFLHK